MAHGIDRHSSLIVWLDWLVWFLFLLFSLFALFVCFVLCLACVAFVVASLVRWFVQPSAKERSDLAGSAADQGSQPTSGEARGSSTGSPTRRGELAVGQK